ncbi:MAG: hypothetical protein ACE5JL_04840 [Dehalococcoidia bacterium]
MGLKVSTGRGTRVRHSTGLEWDDLEKAKKKYTPIRHSTGEDSKIKHSTGTEMDWRALRGEATEDEEEAEQPSRLHSIPAKAQEDTTYLDLYLEQRRNDGVGRHRAVMDERNTPPKAGDKAEDESKKQISEKQFKAVTLDY